MKTSSCVSDKQATQAIEKSNLFQGCTWYVYTVNTLTREVLVMYNNGNRAYSRDRWVTFESLGLN